MFLEAFVRDRETRQVIVHKSDEYKTKQDYEEELKKQGYLVVSINHRKDIEAQNHGYNNWLHMCRCANVWKENPEVFKEEITLFKQIHALVL